MDRYVLVCRTRAKSRESEGSRPEVGVKILGADTDLPIDGSLDADAQYPARQSVVGAGSVNKRAETDAGSVGQSVVESRSIAVGCRLADLGDADAACAIEQDRSGRPADPKSR